MIGTDIISESVLYNEAQKWCWGVYGFNPEEPECVWVTLKKKSLSNIVLKTTWDLKTSQDVSSQNNK